MQILNNCTNSNTTNNKIVIINIVIFGSLSFILKIIKTNSADILIKERKMLSLRYDSVIR